MNVELSAPCMIEMRWAGDSVHLTLMTLAGAWHTGPALADSVVSCSPLLPGVKR